MRLINTFEFKQRVLEEVGRRYPKGRDTAFANAVRCGVRIALRCMEQTPTAEMGRCPQCGARIGGSKKHGM